jgi:hypothetical protein
VLIVIVVVCLSLFRAVDFRSINVLLDKKLIEPLKCTAFKHFEPLMTVRPNPVDPKNATVMPKRTERSATDEAETNELENAIEKMKSGEPRSSGFVKMCREVGISANE